MIVICKDRLIVSTRFSWWKCLNFSAIFSMSCRMISLILQVVMFVEFLRSRLLTNGSTPVITLKIVDCVLSKVIKLVSGRLTIPCYGYVNQDWFDIYLVDMKFCVWSTVGFWRLWRGIEFIWLPWLCWLQLNFLAITAEWHVLTQRE